MIEHQGTVKLVNRDVRKMRLNVGVVGSGRAQPSFYSVKEGELHYVCQCGRKVVADRETLEDALGLGKASEDADKPEYVMEGVISPEPEAGDLIFLVDNVNSHNYPLATLLICGGKEPDLSALYVWTNGNLRTGNSLPTNRIFRPTRLHVDMVPGNKIMKKLVESSDIEIFGVLSKSPVVRKSSRTSKTRSL